MRLVKRLYAPVLRFTMRYKLIVIGITGAVLVIAFGMIAPNLGSEFVPRLSEGAIVIGVVRLAGTDLEESVRASTQMEKAIRAASGEKVRHVWSRTGTAEIATDPMGVELTDVFISLKPRSQWTKARTQDELVLLIDKEIRHLPGQQYEISQPIEQRVNEMISGVRSDVAVKVFGDDLEVLKEKAAVVKDRLEKIRGSADVKIERMTSQPVLQIKVNQDAI